MREYLKDDVGFYHVDSMVYVSGAYRGYGVKEVQNFEQRRLRVKPEKTREQRTKHSRTETSNSGDEKIFGVSVSPEPRVRDASDERG